MLAPYQRERHKNKLINVTGGVNAKTGPGFQQQILKYGFSPILGMSAPLSLVSETGNIGDPETICESLKQFEVQFEANQKSN